MIARMRLRFLLEAFLIFFISIVVCSPWQEAEAFFLPIPKSAGVDDLSRPRRMFPGASGAAGRWRHQQPAVPLLHRCRIYYHATGSRHPDHDAEEEKPADDSFMASLRARVNQINESQLPLVILDDEFLLPRQVLDWTVQDDPVLMKMIRTRLQAEMPTFGVLGRSSSSGMVYPNGVEVEIVETPQVTERNGEFRLKIRGTRVFRIQATTLGKATQGWKQAPVEFVDFEAEEAAEDVFSMAVSLQRAREFTDPNVSMNEEKSLVDMWIDLARTKEITPGQIDRLLQDLGPRPSWKSPSDCAFWVVALINPIPTLGVAWEVRSKLLMAKTTDERTQIALNGIWNSIQHMEAADNRFRQIKE